MKTKSYIKCPECILKEKSTDDCPWCEEGSIEVIIEGVMKDRFNPFNSPLLIPEGNKVFVVEEKEEAYIAKFKTWRGLFEIEKKYVKIG